MYCKLQVVCISELDGVLLPFIIY